MKRIELKKVSIVFLTMLLFLSIQIPAFAADTDTTVKIPVEQIFEVNNSADADKTGSYVLIADQIQNPMPEGSNRRTFTWNMSGNSSTELIMNVGQVGEYHYKLYQATENKENYTYDRSSYIIAVYIKNGENGKLVPQVIAEKNDGKKYGELMFYNSYNKRNI